MAWKGIYWKGRGIVIPGAYSYVNADAMNPDRLSPANTIGAVGICKGGKPQTAIRTTKLREAISVLRGGDLKTAAEFMYDPSSDLPGAGEVVFVRVNNATQSSYAIGSQMTLTSRDYGEHNNFIRAKVETGTVVGKKITIQHQADDFQEIFDNIGKSLILQYVGSLAYCRASITKGATNLITIETSTNGSSWTQLVQYNLDQIGIDTIGALAIVLDGHQDLTCTVHRYADSTMACNLLEALTNQDIKTAPYELDATVGHFYHVLNTYSQLITCTKGVSFSGSIANFAWTQFTGGSEGSAPTNNDWANAIAKLEMETDVKLVYVASDVESIHLIALQHCEQMSDIKEAKERILVCGGAASETVDQVITRAINMGSKRSMLVYPGVKRYNLSTGTLDNIAPSLTSAIAVGMAAGVTPEVPLTHKTIKVQGIEKQLSNTELENLLNHGVCPLQYVKDDGIYHIVQSITTWQKDANVIYRKLSGMRIHDYLRQETRNTAKRFIGEVADATAMVSIKNAIAAKLDLLTRTANNPTGILTPVIQDGKIGPAWTNLIVSFDGFDWVTVTFEAHPVGEIAYITIDATLLPSRITL